MAGGFGAAAAAMMVDLLAGEAQEGNVAVENIVEVPSAERAAQVGRFQRVLGNPVMSVMDAPIRLFRHLLAMKEELLERKNLDKAERLVRGMKFSTFEENVCAIQYKGIPVINPAGENEEEKFPFKKIVEGIITQYQLDDNTKNNLLNAKLCDQSTQLNMDIKFNVGEAGHFYYGKFMACNIGGKIDFCFMFYRLKFQIQADMIEETIAKKFLCFTVGHTKTYKTEEVIMAQADLEDFQNYFRIRLFDLLGGEIKGLADTDPPDALTN